MSCKVLSAVFNPICFSSSTSLFEHCSILVICKDLNFFAMEDDSVKIMREKFNNILKSMIVNKRADNNFFLSANEYAEKIRDVSKSKEVIAGNGEKKTIEYRLVRRFDVMSINGKQKLVKPTEEQETVLYYATNEEMFDVLHKTHLSIGHGGRDRMLKELKTKYCNVTRETVMAYVHTCIHCQKKSSNKMRGLAMKPILH